MVYAHTLWHVVSTPKEKELSWAGEIAQRIKLSPHNREDRSSDLLTHPKLTQKLTALV